MLGAMLCRAVGLQFGLQTSLSPRGLSVLIIAVSAGATEAQRQINVTSPQSLG
jgi:hypothetical protein